MMLKKFTMAAALAALALISTINYQEKVNDVAAPAGNTPADPGPVTIRASAAKNQIPSIS
ncbi:MAG: hypothetical protein WCH43_04140 [Verrucomicrobiota bacterium]